MHYTSCLIQIEYFNMRKQQLIDELLSTWEETYKKGQLYVLGFIIIKKKAVNVWRKLRILLRRCQMVQ